MDLREVHRQEVERLSVLELIDVDSERVRLSHRGCLVGNRVFGAFLPAL